MVVMALFCFGGEKLVNEEYQPRGVPTLKAHDHTCYGKHHVFS